MDPVRLMTANLLYQNGATAEALRETLDLVKPDLLAVQELTKPLHTTIIDRFPNHLLNPRSDGFGLGIATDRAASFDPLPMPYRSGLIATLTPQEWPEFAGPVEVFNLHLGNPIEQWPWTMTRIRRAQVEALERRTSSGSQRRVICGDLNATPLWPAYRRLLRSHRDGVLDAAARQDSRPARTWASSRAGPRLLRIDHVLVSGMWVASAETIPLPGSDHHALVADLVDTPPS